MQDTAYNGSRYSLLTQSRPLHSPKRELLTSTILWGTASLVVAVLSPSTSVVAALVVAVVLFAHVLVPAPVHGKTAAGIASILCVGIYASGPHESNVPFILALGLVNVGTIFGTSSAERLRSTIAHGLVPSSWKIEVDIEYPAGYKHLMTQFEKNAQTRPLSPGEDRPRISHWA